MQPDFKTEALRVLEFQIELAQLVGRGPRQGSGLIEQDDREAKVHPYHFGRIQHLPDQGYPVGSHWTIDKPLAGFRK